ncbi:type II secretion system F family protein [Sporosarcina sp. ACRSM]|uniref:competence type IV pilus assembly protein ComGB n=1 Tax=Sporosarcina sp. ACRSM TaxID=2918216 RepID=UPI001EF46BA7|nr:competence type IV pilus assembly protein ComGB [Sporosarcina sp. ACRSM]MCG7336370.1 type II secretion system F family protein [Sporosarcina sp. ACRSM]
MNSLFRKFYERKASTLQNKPVFLERLAELLQEGYTFNEGMTLLLPHHINKFKPVLLAVEDDLKSGFGVTAILRRLGFSDQSLLPVAIAEVDGQLVRALKGMADRLKKKEAKQKKLKKLLIYPTILFLFILTLLLAFRSFFLPHMEMLTASRMESTTGFAKMLPALVTKIPDFSLAVIFFGVCTFVMGNIILKKLKPAEKVRLLLLIPVVRTMYILCITRDFSGELGSLLDSGLSMQNALAVLINQQVDGVLTEIASNVKTHVVFGEPFHIATQLTVGLTEQLSAFAKHGEDSGHLAKELLIYSRHLEQTIDEKLNKGLAMLQPMLFCIIAICILAAYLALLLPVYGLMDNL